MKVSTFFLLLLLPLFLPGQSDKCARYDDMIKKAQQALRAGDYQTALFQLQAAKEVCYEKSTQADQLIREVFEVIEINIRKAKQTMEIAKDDPTRFPVSLAAYLMAEAQRAFVREDIRLAWRLTLEALEQDPANDKAQHLKQELPAYGADTYLGDDGAEYNHYTYSVSPDSTHFSFFSREADGQYNLNVLELGGDESLRTFPNSGYSSQFYNRDGRYLVFLTGLTGTGLSGTLNVLDLQGNKVPQTFPDSYRHYFYSPDGRRLVFLTNVAEDHGTLNVLELGGNKPPRTFPNSYLERRHPSLDGRYLLFFTNVADGAGTLNVLELGGDQPPRTFPDSDYDSYRHSPDRRHLVFSTKAANGGSTLNVLELGGNKPPRTFPNSNRQWNPYSPDGRRLVFHANVTDSIGTLNVLELGSDQPPRTFPNSDRDHYRFSPDGRHLVFYTDVADGQGAPNVLQRLFGKKGKKKNIPKDYSLNVLELGGDRPPQTFPNGDRDHYRFSPDSRHLVFLSNVEDYVGTLNVLELGGNKSPLTFPDCGDYEDEVWYRYSPDGRHLVFLTDVAGDAGTLNVLELGGNRSPLIFPNCGDYDDGDWYRYSPDSRYLTFFTNVANGEGALNVLELGGNKAPHTFPNCDLFDHEDRDYDLYSPDSRYLVFFTNVTDDIGTLNVLELGAGKPSFTFPKCHSLYYGDWYRYSPDSRHLVFFTNVTKDAATLNVLELGGDELPQTFLNSRTYGGDYSYSPDGRRLVFFSKEAGGETRNILNVLDLEGDKSLSTFPKIEGYSYRNLRPYSPDGRHVVILAADGKTINILNLDRKKILRQIKNQYSVQYSRFLNNNHLMVVSRLPSSKNEIFKIINLDRIGEGYWDYLTKERYAPLTAEEKRTYGIVK